MTPVPPSLQFQKLMGEFNCCVLTKHGQFGLKKKKNICKYVWDHLDQLNSQVKRGDVPASTYFTSHADMKQVDIAGWDSACLEAWSLWATCRQTTTTDCSCLSSTSVLNHTEVESPVSRRPPSPPLVCLTMIPMWYNSHIFPQTFPLSGKIAQCRTCVCGQS